MRLEEMKNNIPETPDFIHKMVQEEVSRQLQDTKVVPMKKRKWNKVQAAAAAALCLLATSTVAYAGNRLYHMYVEKQGTYSVATGHQADGNTTLQLPEQVRRRKVLRGKFLGAVGDQADPPVVRTQAAQQQRVFLVRLFGENDELCRNHINPVVS